MTPQYRVTALRMGRLTPGRPSLVGESTYVRTAVSPIWSAAIEGNGHRIVVDTGMADRTWVEKYISPCSQEPDETIEGALLHIGWEPRTVDIVINTHLHYDHCGGNRALTGANFRVSAREWEFAQAPIESQSLIYDKAWLQGGLAQSSYRFTVDEEELLPGIRIIFTPGHTPGHQSVLVNTAEGIVAITGDAVRVAENVRPGLPPRILHDAAQAAVSVDRIKTLADRFLAGHDAGIVKYKDRLFPLAK
jgi:N-acyl homoserine lactone hydrolase